jgi:hypothetical protein
MAAYPDPDIGVSSADGLFDFGPEATQSIVVEAQPQRKGMNYAPRRQGL